MKQTDKTKKTKERILSAAMEEFGTHSYEAASMNRICEKNDLSKGLIYHNYKHKDELYLACVQKCFCDMSEFWKKTMDIEGGAKECLKKAMAVRREFFNSHPYHTNIFFNILFRKPQHLADEIEKLRYEFDEFNYNIFKLVFSKMKLRKGITSEVATEYFSAFVEMYNAYFQMQLKTDEDFNVLIGKHEEKMEVFFDLVLYGIAEEE